MRPLLGGKSAHPLAVGSTSCCHDDACDKNLLPTAKWLVLIASPTRGSIPEYLLCVSLRRELPAFSDLFLTPGYITDQNGVC